MLALAYAVAAAAATAACPFPATSAMAIATLRDLPPDAAQLLGDMADRGEPFQATDGLLPGKRLPFSRFMSAQGRGCDLMVEYEHGGRGYSKQTVRLRFDAGTWVVAGR